MNPIRRKAISSVTEAAYKEIEALDPESVCAKHLSEIEDVDAVIAEDVGKICKAATLGEMAKAFMYEKQLKRASGQEKKRIEEELNDVAEQIVRRAESKSGPLRLSKVYEHLFSEL